MPFAFFMMMTGLTWPLAGPWRGGVLLAIAFVASQRIDGPAGLLITGLAAAVGWATIFVRFRIGRDDLDGELPVERISWSLPRFRRNMANTVGTALPAGIIGGALTAYLLDKGIWNGMGLGLLIGMGCAVVLGYAAGVEAGPGVKANIGARTSVDPSFRFATIAGLIGAIVVTLVTFTIWRMAGGIGSAFVFTASSAAAAGLMLSSRFGGRVAYEHLRIRDRLRDAGVAPWLYNDYLETMTERLFLFRIGLGYRFVHRSLQEHLAASYSGSEVNENMTGIEAAILRNKHSDSRMRARAKLGPTGLGRHVTPDALKALRSAEEVARRHGAALVSPEHLLVAVLKPTSESRSSQDLLKLMNLTEPEIYRLDATIEQADDQIWGELEFSPQTKKVLQKAVSVARHFKHRHVGNGHISHALLNESDIAKLLARSGVHVNYGQVALRLIAWEESASPGALKKAANAGDTHAMFNLALLLANQLDPDLAGARRWYERPPRPATPTQ